jgi:hypothetical protein
MSLKKYSRPLIILILILVLVSLGLASACSTGGSGTAADEGLKTWMLVRAPDSPLPANRPVTVKSRTRDPNNHLSHVELYAVEIPTTDNPGATQTVNLLIDTQIVPFEQTTFTANQTFIPAAVGEYVIKVVGYNNNQEKTESEYIRFAVQ